VVSVLGDRGLLTFDSSLKVLVLSDLEHFLECFLGHDGSKCGVAAAVLMASRVSMIGRLWQDNLEEVL